MKAEILYSHIHFYIKHKLLAVPKKDKDKIKWVIKVWATIS